jgi:hypothetical protein
MVSWLILLYLVVFTGLTFLAFRAMFRNLRSFQRAEEKSTRSPAPHPELLDSDGNPLTEPLLVVNFVESPDDVRRRLEEIYNRSQDAPER